MRCGIAVVHRDGADEISSRTCDIIADHTDSAQGVAELAVMIAIFHRDFGVACDIADDTAASRFIALDVCVVIAVYDRGCIADFADDTAAVHAVRDDICLVIAIFKSRGTASAAQTCGCAVAENDAAFDA